MGDSSSFGQGRSKVNKRELGKREIEAAIGLMLVSRKLKLDSLFVWREDKPEVSNHGSEVRVPGRLVNPTLNCNIGVWTGVLGPD